LYVSKPNSFLHDLIPFLLYPPLKTPNQHSRDRKTVTTTPLPYLPVELWLKILTDIPSPTTLWHARTLGPILKSPIEAYFELVFPPHHVRLTDFTNSRDNATIEDKQ
jgi:hypothetical protein